MTSKKFGIAILSALLGLAAMDAAATNVTVDQGQTLFGSEIQTITINPSSGDITIRTKTGNWGLSQSGDTNPPDTGGQLPSLNLLVEGKTAITVSQGASVNLAWTVENAESCVTINTGISAWDNKAITIFSGNDVDDVTLTVNFTGTKSFGISCSNAAGTVNDYVDITGQSGGATPAPDTGSCPNTGGVEIESWTTASGGADFPRFRSTQEVSTRGAEPLAIQFNTATAGSITSGGISVVPSINTYAPREISISECPGDFSVAKTCTRYNVGTLFWEIDLALGEFFTCKLQKGSTGKTYYLNLRFPEGCNGQRFCTARITTN